MKHLMSHLWGRAALSTPSLNAYWDIETIESVLGACSIGYGEVLLFYRNSCEADLRAAQWYATKSMVLQNH